MSDSFIWQVLQTSMPGSWWNYQHAPQSCWVISNLPAVQLHQNMCTDCPTSHPVSNCNFFHSTHPVGGIQDLLRNFHCLLSYQLPMSGMWLPITYWSQPCLCPCPRLPDPKSVTASCCPCTGLYLALASGSSSSLDPMLTHQQGWSIVKVDLLLWTVKQQPTLILAHHSADPIKDWSLSEQQRHPL